MVKMAESSTRIAGFTQAYYDLLDLPVEKQQAFLSKIKLDNPVLYSSLSEFFDNSTHLNFSSLIGFHAEQLMSHSDTSDLCGKQVDKYRLIRELGRGGMGVVYEAERADETFQQKLAIKFIKPMLTEIVGADFLYLEAQLLAKLNHPYIAKVFDGGRRNELIFIAMEKVEGDTLAEVHQQGRLSARQTLALFIKISEAIEHAHCHGILHADIKPENIVIDEHDDPKVLDFNITQRIKSVPASLDGSFLAFSKDFASPEQISAQYLDNRSDVYSLGKLLRYLMPQVSSDIDKDIQSIVAKATQSNPDERYFSVQSLIDDVKNVLAYRPISLRHNEWLYVGRRFAQRKPFHTLAAFSFVCAISLFSGLLIHKNHQLTSEKAIAENMMFEMTQLLYHSKGDVNNDMSVQTMLELTRRRILSSPDLPGDIKQKMLLAMMTPIPERVDAKGAQ